MNTAEFSVDIVVRLLDLTGVVTAVDPEAEVLAALDGFEVDSFMSFGSVREMAVPLGAIVLLLLLPADAGADAGVFPFGFVCVGCFVVPLPFAGGCEGGFPLDDKLVVKLPITTGCCDFIGERVL